MSYFLYLLLSPYCRIYLGGSGEKLCEQILDDVLLHIDEILNTSLAR